MRLRGNIILVQNLTLVVKLCLPMNSQSSLVTLQWFLSEIQKDLKDLRDAERAKRSSAASSEQPCDPPARQAELGEARQEQLVDGILEGLLTHPRCAKALWLPSRSCFRVKKKDVGGKAGQKDFFVRKGPRFWPALQQAGDFALDFLERPDPDEEAGSDSGPDALEIISEAPGEGPVAGPVVAYGHSGNWMHRPGHRHRRPWTVLWTSTMNSKESLPRPSKTKKMSMRPRRRRGPGVALVLARALLLKSSTENLSSCLAPKILGKILEER